MFLVNFQLSVTNLILSGLPSIILLSLSFLTEITSATNFTVANKLSLIFSYFSTEDSFTPINVNSDFMPSLFLDLIASEKLENILFDNKLFSFIRSPVEKYEKIKDNLFATVKFVAEVISVKKDKENKIIEGNPDKIKFVTDSWKFTRNIKQKDLNWYLSEIISK